MPKPGSKEKPIKVRVIKRTKKPGPYPKNSLPEKRVELHLVVNAGSVLEDDDQLGLAHFMEHMNFNGSP